MSYITIYFEDKPVFLCDEITKEINEYRHHPDAVFIDELSTAAINSLLHEIKKPQFHAGIIYNKDFPKLKADFFKHFHLIVAAGGLVKNENEEILMIFRRGKWDLPKGKLNEGEQLEECALREVEEETGLQNINLGFPLTITCHTYHEGTKYMLKESHWFTMNVTGEQKLIPQTEEDILDIKWVEQKDTTVYLPKAYPLISDIMEAAKQKNFISF